MSKIVFESAVKRAIQSHRYARCQYFPSRQVSTSQISRATALPITATGPPPNPPEPSAAHYEERMQQRRRKAEMIQQGKEIRAAQQGKPSPLSKRFWKDVHVKETADGYQVYLDNRPVRTPEKKIITVPKSKAYLAHAIAIEWDLLTSAQQALKAHNIPMTSIVARALDIVEAEAHGDQTIREEILKTMMRYLDTDTILCWAPEASTNTLEIERNAGSDRTLREVQKETAEQIISYLTTTVWPGVEIKPVLEDGNIMPTQQSEVTKSIISGWIWGLPAFELAALERAVLASKSLLIGTRLLIEWSEEFRDLQRSSDTRFGIEEAALASTIEVRWQTGMWGEVEDTHDVDNEDIRRQLGSAILVVSGGK